MDFPKIKKTTEEVIETRNVTATFSFEFKSGKVAPESLQPFYDTLVANNAVEEVVEEEKEEMVLEPVNEEQNQYDLKIDGAEDDDMFSNAGGDDTPYN